MCGVVRQRGCSDIWFSGLALKLRASLVDHLSDQNLKRLFNVDHDLCTCFHESTAMGLGPVETLGTGDDAVLRQVTLVTSDNLYGLDSVVGSQVDILFNEFVKVLQVFQGRSRGDFVNQQVAIDRIIAGKQRSQHVAVLLLAGGIYNIESVVLAVNDTISGV